MNDVQKKVAIIIIGMGAAIALFFGYLDRPLPTHAYTSMFDGFANGTPVIDVPPSVAPTPSFYRIAHESNQFWGPTFTPSFRVFSSSTTALCSFRSTACRTASSGAWSNQSKSLIIYQYSSTTVNATTLVKSVPINVTENCDNPGSGSATHVPYDLVLTSCLTVPANTTNTFRMYTMGAGGGSGDETIIDMYSGSSTCAAFGSPSQCGGGFSGGVSVSSTWYGQFNMFAAGVPTGTLHLPVTSTSITLTCPDLGLFTPLCDLAVWLFIPDFSNFQGNVAVTKDLLITKFPFSYIAGIQNAITTENAGTNTSSTTLTLNFDAISTTTTFGHFMPSGNITAFSSSTIFLYGTPTMWSILKFLLALLIYIGTGEMIYFGILHIFNRNKETV